MVTAIAFYKGPPHDDFAHTLTHYSIRVWTWSKWSHAELFIDGICYSSSVRDGGVRGKVIDLNSGRWDVVYVNLSKEQVKYAIKWFEQHRDDAYDWQNIVRYIIPIVPHHPAQRVCFESIGDMLDMAGSHRLTANDLYEWAKRHEVVN